MLSEGEVINENAVAQYLNLFSSNEYVQNKNKITCLAVILNSSYSRYSP